MRRFQKPSGPVRVDRSNKFGRLARIFLYPVNATTVFDACNGVHYFIGAGGISSTWGCSVRSAISGNIRTAACPSDLLMSKPVTQVMLVHGRAANWTCNKGMRLFDTSSGSGLQLTAFYQSATQVNIQSLTFGDTGAPNTLLTCDPLAPHSYGQTYTAGAARLFIDGVFVGFDGVTADADASGADTRVDCFSSSSTDIDYGGAFWLSSVLTDAEMTDFMLNPWQALMPRAGVRPSTAVNTARPWHYYQQQHRRAA